jgi:hypothetical protein
MSLIDKLFSGGLNTFKSEILNNLRNNLAHYELTYEVIMFK